MAEHENILILNEEQIEQKINRLAYQIYEQNFDEEHVLICGIADRGFLLARKIHNRLAKIAGFQLQLCEINLDKDHPKTNEITITPSPGDLTNKSVILCDDVLYTGKTLAYAAIPFLEANVKKLECLVLIQRSHLKFPVQPTYIGMSLATTLQERVSVSLVEGEEERVALG